MDKNQDYRTQLPAPSEGFSARAMALQEQTYSADQYPANVRKRISFSIGMKVFASMLIMTLFLVGISGLNYYTQGKTENGYETAQRLYIRGSSAIDGIEISMLQARRAEKDFILRTNTKYIDQHAKIIDKLETHANEVLAFLREVTADNALIAEYEPIKGYIADYESGFQQLAKGIVAKGKKDQGKVGDLREAVHKLEAFFKEQSGKISLERDLLMLRRHEKDYLLRGDEKYVAKVSAQVKKIRQQSAVLLTSDKAIFVRSLLDSYLAKFQEVVRIEKENVANVAILRSSIHRLEPIIKSLRVKLLEVDSNLLKSVSVENREIVNVGLIISVIAIVIGLIFGVWLGISITKLVNSTSTVISEIASGDLTRSLNINKSNEDGLLGSAINRMADQLRQIVGNIRACSAELTESAADLSNIAISGASSAEESSAQSQNVAAAAEQVSNNVTTVASAVEEMTATIKEISKTVLQSSEVAKKALGLSKAASDTIQETGRNSEEVGAVTDVISNIAQQTNILALNATIEAARAGEAGKGFAVVANEVKDLAKETSKATEEIASKIAGIQSSVTESVDSINEVNKIMEEMEVLSTTVASAVEEQIATASEISRNMNQASSGVNDIVRNITSVADASGVAVEQSTQTKTKSEGLSALSNRLMDILQMFKTDGDSTSRTDHLYFGQGATPGLPRAKGANGGSEAVHGPAPSVAVDSPDSIEEQKPSSS